MKATRIAIPVMILLVAAGCRHRAEIDPSGGIAVVRSGCPTVAVPAGTGDITLFDPATSHDANAIDVTASMTNVRSTCYDTAASGADIQTVVTFDVEARRTRTDTARDVTLPYYLAITQGTTAVIAKRVGRATVHFDAGRDRATTNAQVTALVNRSAATLPSDVKKKLTEKRKAGQEDAAIDPLSRPEIRQAVLRATFEALVGFQLTNDQFKYNATR